MPWWALIGLVVWTVGLVLLCAVALATAADIFDDDGEGRR